MNLKLLTVQNCETCHYVDYLYLEFEGKKTQLIICSQKEGKCLLELIHAVAGHNHDVPDPCARIRQEIAQTSLPPERPRLSVEKRLRTTHPVPNPELAQQIRTQLTAVILTAR